MASRSRVAVNAEPVEEESYNVSESPQDAYEKPVRASRVVRSGWGAPNVTEERRETVKAPYLKLKDNGHRIIKIMDEVPPVHYFQHFVNSIKRSFTCSQVRDEDTNKIVERCPMCDAGHRASPRFMLNVIDMPSKRSKEPAQIVKWDFGTEVKEVLVQYTTLNRDGEEEYFPLNEINRYFEVYHVSVAGRSAPSTKVERLKARDLEDDHGIVPFTQSEIDELVGDDGENLYGEEVVWVSTIKQLQEAADNLTPNDLPKNRR